jgi:hypothetical protein
VGASRISYKEREDGCYPDASYFDNSNGSLFYEVGIQFNVNVKRNQTWKMIVAYEPSDTYTVYMVKCYGAATAAKKGRLSEIKATAPDVYCDQLQAIVEGVYDDIIQEVNGGWIPI